MPEPPSDLIQIEDDYYYSESTNEVWSFRTVSGPMPKSGIRDKTWRKLTPPKTNDYHIIRKPKMYVHRLIALTLVPGWFEGAVVDHINEQKNDNRPENLRWVSRGENTHKNHWTTETARRVANKRWGNDPDYERK